MKNEQTKRKIAEITSQIEEITSQIAKILNQSNQRPERVVHTTRSGTQYIVPGELVTSDDLREELQRLIQAQASKNSQLHAED